jgi:predicted short-subunit dehydrogenase-like oxidoreductase (DUF2520 family)
MFKRVRIIGHGRVGSALAARLRERGIGVDGDDPELVVLCVPDRAIAEVAAAQAVGPWIAHVSGATGLAALAPHANRFGLHPLQTFTRSGAPSQFDGSWAALTAEHAAARARGVWLAETLGLRAFDLADAGRLLYHAGAVMASNYLVTLHRAAGALFAKAGAPPEALLPLMQRTIDNGFDLTGPIARGDWAIVNAHLSAIRAQAPELAAAYQALAEVTVP